MLNNLNNNLVGFHEDEEYLPGYFDEFNSHCKLRQMFLDLISFISKDDLSFTKREKVLLCNKSLETAFKVKIKSMQIFSYVKPFFSSKTFKLDVASTLVINNYNLKQNKTNLLFSNSKLLPLAKLISFCFNNNKMQLMFDINLLFHHFVLKRVKNMHKDKQVIDSGDSICIVSKHSNPIKLYTSWKSIDTKKPNINDELETAIQCIKQSEFKQVYLVYPKDEGFKRHIPVKVKELEDTKYNIKVIPYSLRSTLRN